MLLALRPAIAITLSSARRIQRWIFPHFLGMITQISIKWTENANWESAATSNNLSLAHELHKSAYK
jgi:hypothetical protein